MSDNHLLLWPVRIRKRKTIYCFFRCNKVYPGYQRKGKRYFGWVLAIGPVKIIIGVPKSHNASFLLDFAKQRNVTLEQIVNERMVVTTPPA